MNRRQFVLAGGACCAVASRAVDAARQIVLPLRADSLGRPLADVVLSSLGTHSFLIDTAATHSLMSLELAQMLELPLLTQSATRLSSTHGESLVRSVAVPDLHVGSRKFSPGLMPLVGRDALGDAVGLLGLDAWGPQTLEFDFNASLLTIRSERGRSTRLRTALAATQRLDALAAFDAFVNGVTTRVLPDTGAPRSYGNSALARRLSPGTSLWVRLGSTGIELTGVRHADHPLFDAWGWRDRPALVLGVDALRSVGRFSLDTSRGRLVL